MIHIECGWCETELVLASLDAPTIDCPDGQITVEIAADGEVLALAA
jgi:hypothetical protein